MRLKCFFLILILCLTPIYAQEQTESNEITPDAWNEILDSHDLSSLSEAQLLDDANTDRINDFFSDTQSLVDNSEQFRIYNEIPFDLDLSELTQENSYDPETRTLKNGDATIDIEAIKNKDNIKSIKATKGGGFKIILNDNTNSDYDVNGEIRNDENGNLIIRGDGVKSKINGQNFNGNIQISKEGVLIGNGIDSKIDGNLFSGKIQLNKDNTYQLRGKDSFLEKSGVPISRFTLNDDNSVLNVNKNDFMATNCRFAIDKTTFSEKYDMSGNFDVNINNDAISVKATPGVLIKSDSESYTSSKPFLFELSNKEITIAPKNKNSIVQITPNKKRVAGDVSASIVQDKTKYIIPHATAGLFELSRNGDFYLENSEVSIKSGTEDKTLKGKIKRTNGIYSLFNQNAKTDYYDAKTNTNIRPVNIDKPLYVVDSGDKMNKLQNLFKTTGLESSYVYESSNGNEKIIKAKGQFQVSQDDAYVFSKKNNEFSLSQRGTDFTMQAKALEKNGGKDFLISYGDYKKGINTLNVFNGETTFSRSLQRDTIKISDDFSGYLKKGIFTSIQNTDMAKQDYVGYNFLDGKVQIDPADLQRIQSLRGNSDVYMETDLSIRNSANDLTTQITKGAAYIFTNGERKILVDYLGQYIGDQDLLIIPDKYSEDYQQYQDLLVQKNFVEADKLGQTLKNNINLEIENSKDLIKRQSTGEKLNSDELEQLTNVQALQKMSVQMDRSKSELSIVKNTDIPEAKHISKEEREKITRADNTIATSKYKINDQKLTGNEITTKVADLTKQITSESAKLTKSKELLRQAEFAAAQKKQGIISSTASYIANVFDEVKPGAEANIDLIKQKIKISSEALNSLKKEANGYIDAIKLESSDTTTNAFADNPVLFDRLNQLKAGLKMQIKDYDGAIETSKKIKSNTDMVDMVKAYQSLEVGDVKNAISNLQKIKSDSQLYEKSQTIQDQISLNLEKQAARKIKNDYSIYKQRSDQTSHDAESIIDPAIKDLAKDTPLLLMPGNYALQALSAVSRSGRIIAPAFKTAQNALEYVTGTSSGEFVVEPTTATYKAYGALAVASELKQQDQGTEIFLGLRKQGLTSNDIKVIANTGDIVKLQKLIPVDTSAREAMTKLKSALSNIHLQEALDLGKNGANSDSGKFLLKIGDYYANNNLDLTAALPFWEASSKTDSQLAAVAKDRIDVASTGEKIGEFSPVFRESVAGQMLEQLGTDPTIILPIGYSALKGLGLAPSASALLPKVSYTSELLSKMGVAYEKQIAKVSAFAESTGVAKITTKAESLGSSFVSKIPGYKYAQSLTDDFFRSASLGKLKFDEAIAPVTDFFFQEIGVNAKKLNSINKAKTLINRAAQYKKVGNIAEAESNIQSAKTVMNTILGSSKVPTLTVDTIETTSKALIGSLDVAEKNLVDGVKTWENFKSVASSSYDELLKFKDSALESITNNLDELMQRQAFGLNSRRGAIDLRESLAARINGRVATVKQLEGTVTSLKSEMAEVLSKAKVRQLNGEDFSDLSHEYFRIQRIVDEKNAILESMAPKYEALSAQGKTVGSAKSIPTATPSQGGKDLSVTYSKVLTEKPSLEDLVELQKAARSQGLAGEGFISKEFGNKKIIDSLKQGKELKIAKFEPSGLRNWNDAVSGDHLIADDCLDYYRSSLYDSVKSSLPNGVNIEAVIEDGPAMKLVFSGNSDNLAKVVKQAHIDTMAKMKKDEILGKFISVANSDDINRNYLQFNGVFSTINPKNDVPETLVSKYLDDLLSKNVPMQEAREQAKQMALLEQINVEQSTKIKQMETIKGVEVLPSGKVNPYYDPLHASRDVQLEVANKKGLTSLLELKEEPNINPLNFVDESTQLDDLYPSLPIKYDRPVFILDPDNIPKNQYDELIKEVSTSGNTAKEWAYAQAKIEGEGIVTVASADGTKISVAKTALKGGDAAVDELKITYFEELENNVAKINAQIKSGPKLKLTYTSRGTKILPSNSDEILLLRAGSDHENLVSEAIRKTNQNMAEIIEKKAIEKGVPVSDFKYFTGKVGPEGLTGETTLQWDAGITTVKDEPYWSAIQEAEEALESAKNSGLGNGVINRDLTLKVGNDFGIDINPKLYDLGQISKNPKEKLAQEIISNLKDGNNIVANVDTETISRLSEQAINTQPKQFISNMPEIQNEITKLGGPNYLSRPEIKIGSGIDGVVSDIPNSIKPLIKGLSKDTPLVIKHAQFNTAGIQILDMNQQAEILSELAEFGVAPRVHGSTRFMYIADKVEGVTLDKAIPTLNVAQKQKVEQQLKDIVLILKNKGMQVNDFNADNLMYTVDKAGNSRVMIIDAGDITKFTGTDNIYQKSIQKIMGAAGN